MICCAVFRHYYLIHLGCNLRCKTVLMERLNEHDIFRVYMNVRIVDKIKMVFFVTDDYYFQTGSIENTVCKVTSSILANQRKMFRVAQWQYLL
jgi:hypothetical protein